MSVLQVLNGISGGVLGAVWLYHCLSAQRGMRQIADLTQPEYAVDSDAALPRVSIVVPARNEAATIEPALRSLLAIDYPGCELLVVNDRSEDATGAILDRLQAEFGARLHVLHLRELPAGWLGKTHAMWRAAEEARGEWILFTDADVHQQKDALRRAVHYAERVQAAHMVLLPTLHMKSLGERMMIPFFQAIFLFQHRLWKVHDPNAPDFLGVGAFNLVRRDAYRKIGTYQSMRLSVIDDMDLAARLKGAGFASRVAFGYGMVHLHWAAGAAGVVRNLSKNFFAYLRYNIAYALVAMVGLLWLHLGPWVGTLWSAGWARAGYALALACLFGAYVAISRRDRVGIGILLLHPAATLLMAYSILHSMALTLARGGVEWRGTLYPLDELKKKL